jgi:hypothetical protein
MRLIGVCVGTFLVNHAFSFVHNFRSDRSRKPNIGAVMFFPYARIMPLHLTILFGLFLARSVAGVIFFLLLKSFADLVMHILEHAGSKLPGAHSTAA